MTVCIAALCRRFGGAACLFVLAIFPGAAARAQDAAHEQPVFWIDTVAGSDRPPAIWANQTVLATAYGIAVDAAGDVLIADTFGHCVWRASADGRMSIVAGTREPGYSGDGGPATAARLNQPRALAFGDNGILYVSDGGNNAIRVIAPDGAISTLEFTVAPSSIEHGNRLRNPSFIRYDPSSRRLYVAEGSMVRYIDSDRVLHPFAGTGKRPPEGSRTDRDDGRLATEVELAGVEDVIVAPDETVLISQSRLRTIRQVLTDGTIWNMFEGSDVVDDSGTPVELGSIGGMTFGPDGRLYFSDFTAWHIYRLNSNGSLTALTPPHSDGSRRGAYYWPWSLAFGPGGDLYFSQFSMGAVRRLSPTGAVTNVAGVTERQGDGGPATSAQLFRPADVAFDSLGNMFIADSSNAVIRRVSTAGIIETIAGTGERLNLATKGASARETPIGFVSHLAAHMDTIYFVTQSDIWSISPGGEIAAIAHLERENDVQPPMGDVHTAADGKVYFSDIYKNTIWCIQKRESSPVIVAGRGGRGYRGDGSAAINAALSGPMALTTDPYGNLYFLDYHNRRIRRVSASGVISTIAGNGEKSPEFMDGEWALEVPLHDPQRLAWGPDDALYLSDGRAIRRIFMADVKSESRQDRGVGPGAAIATVAGGSIAGFSGDGGPARMARLDTPTGMAFGPDGNLYFADTGNNRIRVLRRGGPTPRPAQ